MFKFCMGRETSEVFWEPDLIIIYWTGQRKGKEKLGTSYDETFNFYSSSNLIRADELEWTATVGEYAGSVIPYH
jgi:hypothetical protein